MRKNSYHQVVPDGKGGGSKSALMMGMLRTYDVLDDVGEVRYRYAVKGHFIVIRCYIAILREPLNVVAMIGSF